MLLGCLPLFGDDLEDGFVIHVCLYRWSGSFYLLDGMLEGKRRVEAEDEGVDFTDL